MKIPNAGRGCSLGRFSCGLILFLLLSHMPSQRVQAAPTNSKGKPATEAKKTKPSASKATAKKTTKKRSRSSRRSRSRRRKVVLGQRTIEPERVIQIQNALAGAGYYKEKPTGEWDEPTTKAMTAYQEENGFKTTGKPDALSLKKLGL